MQKEGDENIHVHAYKRAYKRAYTHTHTHTHTHIHTHARMYTCVHTHTHVLTLYTKNNIRAWIHVSKELPGDGAYRGEYVQRGAGHSKCVCICEYVCGYVCENWMRVLLCSRYTPLCDSTPLSVRSQLNSITSGDFTGITLLRCCRTNLFRDGRIHTKK
jgi:hypothetical protein